MAVIPPWLIPPDFLAVMSRGSEAGVGPAQAGASAGLSVDRNRLEQESIYNSARNAAGQLGLGYAHLAAQQQGAAKAAAAEQEQAKAALALRAGQSSALEDYRQREIAIQQQHADQAAASAKGKVGTPADLSLVTLGGKQFVHSTKTGAFQPLDNAKPGTVHFMPSGEIVRVEHDGSVKVLRNADGTVPKSAGTTGTTNGTGTISGPNIFQRAGSWLRAGETPETPPTDLGGISLPASSSLLPTSPVFPTSDVSGEGGPPVSKTWIWKDGELVPQ